MALDHSRLLAASLTVALFGGVSCSTAGNSAADGNVADGNVAGGSVAGGSVAGGSVAGGSVGAGSVGAGSAGDRPGPDLVLRGDIANDRLPAGAPQGQDQRNLDQQRREALVAKYLDNAKALRLGGKLEAAKFELMKAHDLAPANQEVANLINAINADLGLPSGDAASFDEQQMKLAHIQLDRRRAAVTQLLQDARGKMEAKDFAGAAEDLRHAELDITTASSMDWGDLPKQVQALKTEAETKRTEQVRAQNADVAQRLAARLREENEATVARRRAQVEHWLQQAQLAFQSKRFQYAADLALKAEQTEPNNALAVDLHNAALKAARDDIADTYYNEKSRELRNMLEAMEELKVPQTDVLRVDPETWEKALRRLHTAATEAPVDPANQAVLDKVRTTEVGKLNLTEENGAYADVVKLLQQTTSVPIIITPEARELITGENLKLTIELVNSITLENFLNHMTGRSQNLAWTVRNGVVVIGNKAQAAGANVLHTYDVRDLVFKRTQFLPPRIRDIPGEDGGKSETPRTGGESEDKIAFVEMDALQTNIKEATDLKYWEGEGVQLKPEDNGYLVINCSSEMHRRVEGVLGDMRRFATSAVTIDSKFLTVTRNFLQQVGFDFRGLGGSGNKGTVAPLDDLTNGLQNNASQGLDNGGTGDPAANPLAGAFFNDGRDGDIRGRTENFFGTPLGRSLNTNGGLTAGWSILDNIELNSILRAVEKQEDAEVVNSQILSVMDNERGHVAVVNQTAYIRDFDVEVAQASFIADPKVDVIQDGVVLDVKPVIQQDRKYIILDLAPTVAELTRPIPTFTTSLAGSTLPVTLQLPNLTVTNFQTTAKVPDGGTVLIGGLRQSLNKERRAEIPVLAQLPLISFLFKEEGTADENKSLMVMVRAWITDVRDLLAK